MVIWWPWTWTSAAGKWRKTAKLRPASSDGATWPSPIRPPWSAVWPDLANIHNRFAFQFISSSFYLIEQLIQKWGSATSCFIRQMFDYWNDMQMSFHHLPPHAVIDESIISIETLAQGNESEWISLCLRSCWRCIIQSAMTSHSPFDTDRCGEQFELNWILLFRQNVFRKVCTLQWNRPFWRESVMESDCSGRPMASRALLYANFRPSRWIGSNFAQLSDSPLPWSFIDLSI